MPERIQTAELVAVDPETLEVNDHFPGTYGFYVRLSRDPGTEWAAELESNYAAAAYPAKPPILFRGDTLCVYYLPRYGADLGAYLDFLEGVVAKTNEGVERRNAILPDDAAERTALREQLHALAIARKGRR